MRQAIDTAVILAAGLGSRLGDHKENQPKAFVKIGGETLIERSLRLLIDRGVDSIFIGTGYKHEFFDALASKYPQVSTSKNPDFSDTGSMYTLYLMRSLINKPCLLLEGDLLYEPAALDWVMNDSHDDVILASDATRSGDEVFIEVDGRNLLVAMSKDMNLLTQINGELVGISKLSTAGLKAMADFAETKYLENRLDIHYEDAMVGAASTHKLFVKVVKDLAWCEIDDPSHLERARSIIYPRILNRTSG